jgi:hypothetical protein
MLSEFRRDRIFHSQFFVRTHDEMLSVVAMRVKQSRFVRLWRSRAGSQAPTGFPEFVSVNREP